MKHLIPCLVSAIVSVLLLWTESGFWHSLIVVFCWLAAIATWGYVYWDRDGFVVNGIMPLAPATHWIALTAIFYITTLFFTGHWVLAMSSIAINVWALWILFTLPSTERMI